MNRVEFWAIGISGYQMAIRHGQVESTRHAVHQRPSKTDMALLRAQQVTVARHT